MFPCISSRRIRIAIISGMVALVGCASQDKRSSSTATTPEEKTRQEQLDRMAAEDAARAGAEHGTKSQPRPQPIEKRQSGQRVIDQPRIR